MPKIFISYRRADSHSITGRIYDRLVAGFGKGNVFKDVDAIPPGVDFRQVVNDSVAQCDVLLAVIGKGWVDATDKEGRLRLYLKNDVVRMEIEAALRRDIPVVPVLVEGAPVPQADELPPSLKDLVYRNASPVRHDPDFNHDMDRLIRSLKKHHAQPVLSPVGWKVPAAVTAGVLGLCAIAWMVLPRGDPAPVMQPRPDVPPVTRPSPSPAETAKSTLAPAAAGPSTKAIPDEGLRPGQERDDNALKMMFCWCPPGSFKMGSPPGEPDRYEDEAQVDVTLGGFWMGKYEVTQGQWQQVMGTSVRDLMGKAGASSPAGEGQAHPMYYVNHAEAEQFCQKFTETERAAGRLSAGWEYRLPTEAQWEYACRAGNPARFSFGDDVELLGDYAWFNQNAWGKTHRVGERKPNAFGLRDMHGNVWEWCRDGYVADLPGGVDPEGPAGASDRVVRGGSWSDYRSICRSAKRGAYSPAARNSYLFLGFRVARVSVKGGR
jgi:formylglycine-generating enzyme required for sulfatase activity